MKFVTLIFLISSFASWAQVRRNVTLSQPLQVLADAGGDLQIAQGSSVVIGGYPAAKFGTSGYTYLWQPATGLSNSTIANPVAAPLNTTKYKLIVTDSYGCSAIDSLTVTVGSSNVEALFLSNISVLFDAKLKCIAIVLPNNIGESVVNIEIFDILGKQTFAGTISNSSQISCAKFTKGIYLVKIDSNNHSIVKKISVN